MFYAFYDYIYVYHILMFYDYIDIYLFICFILCYRGRLESLFCCLPLFSTLLRINDFNNNNNNNNNNNEFNKTDKNNIVY
jgi:hypothetical protein